MIKVNIIQGDITAFEGDAIVNAANVTLEGGGGVDGAIHKAAGPELKEECMNIPAIPDNPSLRCRVGDVRVTWGYDLKAKLVIHTVGPIWPVPDAPRHPGNYQQQGDPKRLLEKCVFYSILNAQVRDCETIAFPAISCGVFGGEVPVFAEVAHTVIAGKHYTPLKEIIFYLFNEKERRVFQEKWDELEKTRLAKLRP